jgi:hypothetical protein
MVISKYRPTFSFSPQQGRINRHSTSCWSLAILILLVCSSTICIPTMIFHEMEVTKRATITSMKASLFEVSPHHIRVTSSQGESASNNNKLSQNKQRQLVTVFSSSCSKSQDWQSQVLLYSHRQHNIPGELVRLLSCDDVSYTLPKVNYSKYRVVRTPDFNARFPKDDYSARNRPMAMEYWLNGESHDDPNPPSGDDTIIMAVDPDMLYLHSQTLAALLDLVQPGHGVAARYALGSSWIGEKTHWNRFWCSTKQRIEHGGVCPTPKPSSTYNPSFGHPQLLTADDAKRHATFWTPVTNDMRKLPANNGWQTEMNSNIISMYRANITIQVEDIMIGNPGQVEEGRSWQAVQWFVALPQRNKAPYLIMAHYCQRYQLGQFVFAKKNSVFFQNLDLSSCRGGDQDGSLLLPSISGKTYDMIAQFKYNHSILHGIDQDVEPEWLTVLARNGWMIDKVYSVIQQAVGAYYEEFCHRSSFS